MLVSEVSYIVLDTCIAFISKFRNLLWSKLELFEDSVKTLVNILHHSQSVDVYSKVRLVLFFLNSESDSKKRFSIRSTHCFQNSEAFSSQPKMKFLVILSMRLLRVVILKLDKPEKRQFLCTYASLR